MYAQTAFKIPEAIMPEGHVPSDELVFHLGITMAGAVSAGAYTSGVIYQLIEMLDAWEAEKQKNRDALARHPDKEAAIAAGDWDPSIPMHDVVIDVLGGASAGAVAAVLTAMSFLYHKGTVENVLSDNQDCMLFDAWVNLNDPAVSGSPDGKTLEQMLKTSDLKATGKFLSLLQDDPLDYAAQRVLANLGLRKPGDEPDPSKIRLQSPRYASDKLDVILTITSLRGARAQLFFARSANNAPNASGPAHVMKLHRGVAHFTIDSTPDPQGTRYYAKQPVDLKNYMHLKLMIDTALASGAFPIGLPPRKLNLTSDYLNDYLTKYYGKDLVPEHMSFPDTSGTQDFETYSVDGGTMNNEPFAEVFGALEEKTLEAQEGSDRSHCTAFIVIDPFPNFEDAHKELTAPPGPSNVLQAAKELIGAMLNQARVKDRVMLERMMDDSTYGMIFPSYRPSPYNGEALATGAFEGFAGFLDRSLRVHDFELGRRNCESFLRKYFGSNASKPADEFRLFPDWSVDDPRFNRFAHEVEGVWRIPIIPDVKIQERADYGKADITRSYPRPVKAYLDDINALKPVLRRRIMHAIFVLGWKNLKNQLARRLNKSKDRKIQIWTEKIKMNATGEWIWTLVGILVLVAPIFVMVYNKVQWWWYVIVPAVLIALVFVIVQYLANRSATYLLKIFAKDLRSRNQLKSDKHKVT